MNPDRRPCPIPYRPRFCELLPPAPPPAPEPPPERPRPKPNMRLMAALFGVMATTLVVPDPRPSSKE